MHIDKTHGCHPSDYYDCDKNPSYPCEASISNVTWYPGILEITVNTGGGFSPQAFGHFTFSDARKCQVAGQYTSNWTFDASQTPQKGIYYDIWLSVYWECSAKVLSAIRCAHQDVHYRNIVV
ncbi:19239_t:CDS:2 [Gigaspora rosea]|nr:19239_t:CDS:2 [Gigaspora rosea]